MAAKILSLARARIAKQRIHPWYFRKKSKLKNEIFQFVKVISIGGWDKIWLASVNIGEIDASNQDSFWKL